jgi:hypothetical protein
MRTYWLRIALGAVGIFAIGMVVWTLGLKGKAKLTDMVESADPITIPLALIPFKVDGQSLGTLRQVQIIRSEPEKVKAVNFRVRLADSVSDARLEDCILVVGGALKNIDAQHAFSCVPSGDTVGGVLAPVGEVTSQRGRTFVLFAKAGALDSLEIDFGRGASDSVAAAQREFADSIRAVEEAKADSIRDSARAMADSIRENMNIDSIVAAHRPAMERATKAGARVQVVAPPAPPSAPALPKP